MPFTSQLLHFLRRAGTERSTARVIAEMFQFVGEAFTVERVSLHLADPETGALAPFVSQFASGKEDPALYERWRAFDMESTELTQQVRRGADVVLLEEPTASGGLPQGFVETFDVGSFLAVALRRPENLEGVLIIEGPVDTLRRRQDDAAEFARYLTLAIENARAFEREQERTAEAHALLEVVDVLSRTTDLVPVLTAVTRQCAKVTGFERCSVFLVDPDTNTLVPTMSQFADGHSDPAAWERFRTTETDLPIAWEVIRSGEPAAFERPEDHPDLIPREWLDPFDIGTVLYLPLSAWGQRFGVLELDNRERTDITDRQLRIARVVAAQGAVAIGVSRALDRERAAAAELERVNRAKDEFLSMASHEMRTPLSSIHGFADLLDKRHDELDAGERREMARRIRANAERQIELIDDLLSSDRLASGAIIVDRRHVQLRELTVDTVDTVDVNGARVEIDVDGSHEVLADPGHVRQILTNLLSNADRYGRPPFSISSVADPDAGTVTLRVRDRGDGIPDEFLPHLFERFTQAGQDEDSPGIGLGLSIARQMALANDGDLVYEAEGDGACFALTLPQFGRGRV